MPWLADLVPITIRGRWMSLRDSLNAAGSVAIGLITGYLLDHMPGFPGYAVVFFLGGTFGVLDMCCFIPVVEIRRENSEEVKIRAIWKHIFGDKPFFLLMLFWTAWCFTANLSGPFLSRYALGEMGLSYMQLSLYGFIAPAMVTVLVIPSWGKLLDRYGNKPILWVSCSVAALTPAFFLFSIHGSMLPILLHNVIGAAFWSAGNLTTMSMLLSCSPVNHRATYVAIFSCFTSLLGAFFGVISGGALLELMQRILEHAGTLPFLVSDRYKIVVLISVVSRFCIVLFFLPRLRNERSITVPQMMKDIFQARNKHGRPEL